jgi:flagellar biosynthesis protein FlhB
MADSSGKTEKPTQRRLQKAREEGQFPASREFVGAVQFLTFVAIFTWCGAAWFAELKQVCRDLLDHALAPTLDPAIVVQLTWQTMMRLFVPLGIAGGGMLLATVGMQLATTGFGVSFKKLAPSGDKFSPLKKFRELPAQSLPALLQASFMLVFFGAAVYWIVGKDMAAFLAMPLAALPVGIQKVGAAIGQLLWKGAAILFLFGCIDLARQKRKFLKTLKMTKQEIKEEFKESEGDPAIKMRIRRLRRDLLRRGMMSKVPTATAIIVNPTHFAVAIRYKHDEMSTPVVVAKGKNYLALRIRKMATEHQIPIVENPPLAQGLYKAVEVGQEIPPEFYKAVAEILAYIYRLLNR